MANTAKVKTTLIPYYPEYMTDKNLNKLDFYILSKIRNLTDYTEGEGFKGSYYMLKKLACLNDLTDEDIKATLRKLLNEGYITTEKIDDSTMVVKSVVKQDFLF